MQREQKVKVKTFIMFTKDLKKKKGFHKNMSGFGGLPASII